MSSKKKYNSGDNSYEDNYCKKFSRMQTFRNCRFTNQVYGRIDFQQTVGGDLSELIIRERRRKLCEWFEKEDERPR